MLACFFFHGVYIAAQNLPAIVLQHTVSVFIYVSFLVFGCGSGCLKALLALNSN